MKIITLAFFNESPKLKRIIHNNFPFFFLKKIVDINDNRELKKIDFMIVDKNTINDKLFMNRIIKKKIGIILNVSNKEEAILSYQYQNVFVLLNPIDECQIAHLFNSCVKFLFVKNKI